MEKGEKIVKEQAKSLLPGQLWVVGKCVRVRRYEKHFYTVIICPAKDEYSRPSIIEVRSNARFVDPDDKCSCLCEVGGYEGKSYQITDRETGERKSLTPVHMHATLIE